MQQRSEETRGKILLAAQELFSQHGYDATGVAEICQAAGVSKGAFYHHFPSKQAVFLTLLENWLGAIEPQLTEFVNTSSNVADSLVEMSGIFKHIFISGKGQLAMFLEFWVQANRDPAIWKETIAPYHRFENYFAELMRRGVREGSLEEIDPDTGSRVLMALAIGMIVQGLFDADGAPWNDVAQQGMQLLIKGMSRC
jgi:AcrR family transcriptional regulator